MFDHVMVEIEVEESRAHRPGIKLKLVSYRGAAPGANADVFKPAPRVRDMYRNLLLADNEDEEEALRDIAKKRRKLLKKENMGKK